LPHAPPRAARPGAGLDPCGARQPGGELPPGTQLDLISLLGEGGDETAARALVGGDASDRAIMVLASRARPDCHREQQEQAG